MSCLQGSSIRVRRKACSSDLPFFRPLQEPYFLSLHFFTRPTVKYKER